MLASLPELVLRSSRADFGVWRPRNTSAPAAELMWMSACFGVAHRQSLLWGSAYPEYAPPGRVYPLSASRPPMRPPSALGAARRALPAAAATVDDEANERWRREPA